MARILVTGANGFIGQHLVRRLLSEHHQIRCLKNSDLPLHFFDANDVEWRDSNLQDTNALRGICDNIDIVYHLGAIPRNDLSKTWDEFVAVNIKGTETLLKEARDSKVRRFVFISTVESAGYGDGKHPRAESDPPNPDNNYGRSKLEAEKIVMNGAWNMECVTIRLPMVYGPGTLLIVPKLFGMVKQGVYPLINKGDTLMEFCYVENAVQGIVLCGEKLEAVGQLFYVSDERSYSIKEVISAVADSMGKKVLFVKIPRFFALSIAVVWEAVSKILPFPPFTSPYSKKPFLTRETVWWTTNNVNIVSTEKIRNLLGFRPSISIQAGCKATAEWLHSHSAI